MSPPCGPDSPMQNLNQRTDTQIQRLEEKRSSAHRIQKNLMEIFVWLQGTSWCEEAVLEQSSSCRSLCKNGNFSELKRQFHGALVSGCQWGLIVEELVPDYENPQNRRCPWRQILSSRPLPQAIGRQRGHAIRWIHGPTSRHHRQVCPRARMENIQ